MLFIVVLLEPGKNTVNMGSHKTNGDRLRHSLVIGLERDDAISTEIVPNMTELLLRLSISDPPKHKTELTF